MTHDNSVTPARHHAAKPASSGAVAIVVALIGFLSTVVAAYVGRERGKAEAHQEIPYIISVFDASNQQPVCGARATLAGSAIGVTSVTDDFGRAVFKLPKEAANTLVSIGVQKERFAQLTATDHIPSGGGSRELNLKQEATQVAVVSAASATRTSQASVGGRRRRAVASTAATATPLRTERLQISSGAKLSGAKKAWSDWYTLCTPVLVPRSRIVASTFALSGDRTCTAWGQCEQTDSGPTRVCWRFRMQGHDEWPGSGQSQSEGILNYEVEHP